MDIIGLILLLVLAGLIIARFARPDLNHRLTVWIMLLVIVGCGMAFFDSLLKGNVIGAVMVGLLFVGMVTLYRIGAKRDSTRIERGTSYNS